MVSLHPTELGADQLGDEVIVLDNTVSAPAPEAIWGKRKKSVSEDPINWTADDVGSWLVDNALGEDTRRIFKGGCLDFVCDCMRS